MRKSGLAQVHSDSYHYHRAAAVSFVALSVCRDRNTTHSIDCSIADSSGDSSLDT